MDKEKIWVKSMDVGHTLGCHQRPERSFFIKGYQFPVCARCTGVFASTIIALPMIIKKKLLPYNLATILAEVMLFDWTLQFCKIKESTNFRRLITGVIGGFGCYMIEARVISDIIKVFKRKN